MLLQITFCVLGVSVVFAAVFYPSELRGCSSYHALADRTVGRVYLNQCYYLHINDRFYSDREYTSERLDDYSFQKRHMWHYFANENHDTHVSDGLIALLTSEFYAKFKYPIINLQVTHSDYFTINTTSSNCLKLDIVRKTIFSDPECLLAPTIILTDQFNYQHGTFEENFLRNRMYKSSTGSVVPCKDTKDSAVVGSTKCFFFLDNLKSCTIASIQNVPQYRDFERFIIHKSFEVVQKICYNFLVHFTDCFMHLHNNPVHSFIIHLNPALFLKYSGSTYFVVDNTTEGFYIADVIRKRLDYVSNYQTGVSRLWEKHGLEGRLHLCEKEYPPKHKSVEIQRYNIKIESDEVASYENDNTTMPVFFNFTTKQEKTIYTKINASTIIIALACVSFVVFIVLVLVCLRNHPENNDDQDSLITNC